MQLTKIRWNQREVKATVCVYIPHVVFYSFVESVASSDFYRKVSRNNGHALSTSKQREQTFLQCSTQQQENLDQSTTWFCAAWLSFCICWHPCTYCCNLHRHLHLSELLPGWKLWNVSASIVMFKKCLELADNSKYHNVL